MELYKRGQGNWSRGLTALAGFLLAFYGVQEALKTMVPPGAYIVAGLIIAIFAGLACFLAFFQKTAVDTLIDTQVEMQKVSWPDQREVRGSTQVVIICVVILGAFLYVADFSLTVVISWLGIY